MMKIPLNWIGLQSSWSLIDLREIEFSIYSFVHTPSFHVAF